MDSNASKLVSLVVPFYNEKNRIDHSMESLLKFLQDNKKMEIIYVDDGSSDGSMEIIKKKLQERRVSFNLPEIEFNFVKNEINQGKGAAVKNGVLASNGDYIIYTDFDFAISLGEIKNFVDEIEKLPNQRGVVIASRRESSALLENQSILRRFLGKVFNSFMKMIINLPIKDTQCGFKMFDRKSAFVLFPSIKINGFAFDVELLKRAYRNKIPVVEKGVEVYFDDKHSTVNIFLDPLKMIKDLVFFRFRLLIERFVL